MNNLEEFSFTIKYDSKIKDLEGIFKLIYQKGKLYITNFNSEIKCEAIIEGGISDDLIDFFENQPNHYAEVISKKTNHRNIQIAVYNVMKIRPDLEDTSIFYEDFMPERIKILKTINDNDKGLLIYVSIYSEENNLTDFYISNDDLSTCYQVKLTIDSDGESKYWKLNKKPRPLQKEQFQKVLLLGNISFVNHKKYMPLADRQKLNSLKNDIKNYLNIWEKYNEHELKAAFGLFKEYGYVRYKAQSYIDDNRYLKVYFDTEEDFNKACKFKDQMINIGNDSIITLCKTVNLESYKKAEKEMFGLLAITTATFTEKNINHTERTISISLKGEDGRPDSNLIEKYKSIGHGYFCLSLLGNTISYERRRKAKEKIITGQAGIPKIVTWFSNEPQPAPESEHVSIDFSLLSNKKLTSNQLEAIDIICNTPDIAIIQGPPGTGKTTIISESVTQINAIAKKQNISGSNLLSGFRHETVNNVLDKVKLYGLPSIKVGESSKDDNSQTLEPEIIKYIDELLDRLNEKYKDLTVDDSQYTELYNIYTNYINFDNSIESTVELLNKVKSLDLFKSKTDVQKTLDDFIVKLRTKSNNSSPEEDMFVEILYSLPLCKESYDDDGLNLLVNLQMMGMYSKFNKEVDELQMLYNSNVIDFEKIKKIRRNLIVKYRKVPDIFTSNEQKIQIAKYLFELIESVKADRLTKRSGQQLAILEYINSLSENPMLVKDTLMHYTRVLGATNQQTMSKRMYDVKEMDLSFDNVFVDEAATSSPLDLFIPMSISKRRIILVGDHKQLPNIVNENIVQDIENGIKTGNSSEIEEHFKFTMFQMLINKARELEKKDGHKRVITLNSQFRMHPELGNIVSDFYQEEGGLYSPRPAIDFNHNYACLKDKYLYWVDVPWNKGEMYRNVGSTSRKNRLEAERIAQHIEEALNDDSYNKESIGIITFYKDQVQTIKEALRKRGIINIHDEPTGNYMDLEILIGTVDAFQGKEFDIVYLSMTYVFNVQDINACNKEAYSRLVIPNLLNVAVSRQRKLLICVGDQNVFAYEKAKTHVPCLYKIATRCKEAGLHE